jgi:SnoaL-like domain
LNAVVLVAALALPAANSCAQGTSQFAAASSVSEEVGEAYFSAYVARDWDRLAPLLAERGSFADPTAALVFGPVENAGKVATLKTFREGYAAITHMSFNRIRAFFSGHYAVFEGTLDWSLSLPNGGLAITKAMPLVTVLRIEGGQVVEHRDLADYHPYLEARRAATPGG